MKALGADPELLTISGFSSGAYMAMQLDVVYSSTIKGVALHEGGPYTIQWINSTTPFEYVEGTLDRALTMAQSAEKEDKIDKLSNLKG